MNSEAMFSYRLQHMDVPELIDQLYADTGCSLEEKKEGTKIRLNVERYSGNFVLSVRLDDDDNDYDDGL